MFIGVTCKDLATNSTTTYYTIDPIVNGLC